MTKNRFISKIITNTLVVGATLFGVSSIFMVSPNANKNYRNTENNVLQNTKIQNNLLSKGRISSDYNGKPMFEVTDLTSAAVIIGTDNCQHFYIWGSDSLGQQGNGPAASTIVKTPTELLFPSLTSSSTLLTTKDYHIKFMSISKTTSAVVLTMTSDNRDYLYMWGGNTFGQQGNQTTATANTVQPSEYFNNNISSADFSIKNIHLSWTTTGVVLHNKTTNKDSLYMWGLNDDYEQGNGSRGGNVLTPTINSTINTIIDNNPGAQIAELETDNNAGAAVVKYNDANQSTKLFMWGRNNFRQQGSIGSDKASPTEVSTLTSQLASDEHIIQVTLGTTTIAALTQIGTDGVTKLYMWGGNSNGQQGNGNTSTVNSPTLVQNLSDELATDDRIIKISTDSDESSSTVATGVSSALVYNQTTQKHRMYMWGQNTRYQQGKGDPRSNQLTPILVSALTDEANNTGRDITDIDLSNVTSSAILTKDSNDYLYMWGGNSHFQQAGEDTSDVPLPIRIRSTNVKEPATLNESIVQIGESKLKIKFDVEQGTENDSYFNAFFNVQKNAQIKRIFIRDENDVEIEDLNITSFGYHEVELSSFTNVDVYKNYKIAVDYSDANSAVSPIEYICCNLLSDFTINGLKDIKVDNVSTSQDESDSINIKFDLTKIEGIDALHNRDVSITELWIQNSAGEKTAINNYELGSRTVLLTGLSAGTYEGYTLQGTYNDIEHPTQFTTKSINAAIPTFNVEKVSWWNWRKIIGVIAIILLVLTIAGIIFWMFFKRRKNKEEEPA